jgi:RNA polymerase subunit RPABC4/transcription elongation factor Spt4
VKMCCLLLAAAAAAASCCLLLTHRGRYTCPSCAMNSNTPQWVERPVLLLETLNSMGYSMCRDAATTAAAADSHHQGAVQIGSEWC